MGTNSVRKNLAAHRFHPRRSLGQNFLFDPELLARIVDASGAGPGDRVLEIGAGPGTLTRALCQRAAHVTALEVDRTLEPILRETLEGVDNVTLVFEDIMMLDLPGFHRQYFEGQPFRVVANLPYYITTPILMGLLESDLPILSMTVMVQKEVALRICAQPGGRDYGVLSVMAQLYALPDIAATVPSDAFYPAPKVDSALLHMPVRTRCPVDIPSAAAFRQVVKAAFSQRRKQLANSLASGLGLSRDHVRLLLQAAGIRPEDRAETLDLEAFAALTRVLEREKSAGS